MIRKPPVLFPRNTGSPGRSVDPLVRDIHNYGDVFWQLRPEEPAVRRPGREKM